MADQGHVGWSPDYKAPKPPLTPLIQKSLRAWAEAFDMYAWLLAEARWWAEDASSSVGDFEFDARGELPWYKPRKVAETHG